MKIRGIINKIAIFLFIAIFTFIGISTRVKAENLYTLDNLIVNGDFSLDSNSDGLGDGWTMQYAQNPSITDNIQKLYSDGSTYRFRIVSNLPINFNLNHKYYFSCQADSSNTNLKMRFVLIQNNQYYDVTQGSISYIFNSNYNGNSAIIIGFVDSNNQIIPNTIFGYLSNLLLIDLTTAFGAGFEPGITDFETYYLPDGYFTTYSSYYPENTRIIDLATYTNLYEDIDGVNFSRALVDYRGANIDFEVYAKFPSQNIATYYQGDSIGHVYDPYVYINGQTYTAYWNQSDYSGLVMNLVMDDDFKTAFKDVLFNHLINESDEYINFSAYYIDEFYLSEELIDIWLVLSLDFPMNVNIQSFLLSAQYLQYGFTSETNLYNYIKMYDQNNNIMNPVLKLSHLYVGEIKTYYVNDFGTGYTNVSKFNFNLPMISPAFLDDNQWVDNRFYEINMFADNDVLQIQFPDNEVGDLFDTTVCDWYNIPCQAKNIANEFASYVYNGLHIQDIIDTFDDIYAAVNNVVQILPDQWGTIIIIMVVGSVGGLVLLIIDRLRG